MSYKQQVAEKIASALTHLGVQDFSESQVYDML